MPDEPERDDEPTRDDAAPEGPDVMDDAHALSAIARRMTIVDGCEEQARSLAMRAARRLRFDCDRDRACSTSRQAIACCDMARRQLDLALAGLAGGDAPDDAASNVIDDARHALERAQKAMPAIAGLVDVCEGLPFCNAARQHDEGPINDVVLLDLSYAMRDAETSINADGRLPRALLDNASWKLVASLTEWPISDQAEDRGHVWELPAPDEVRIGPRFTKSVSDLSEHDAERVRTSFPYWLTRISDIDGALCPCVLNPAAEFNKKAKAGRLERLSDDDYNSCMHAASSLATLFCDVPRLTCRQMAERITMLGTTIPGAGSPFDKGLGAIRPQLERLRGIA